MPASVRGGRDGVASTQTPEECPFERFDDRALSGTIPSADANQLAAIELKVELWIQPKTPHFHANQLHEPGSVRLGMNRSSPRYDSLRLQVVRDLHPRTNTVRRGRFERLLLLEPMTLEAQRPRVLGDRAHHMLRRPFRNLGFDLQGQLDL